MNFRLKMMKVACHFCEEKIVSSIIQMFSDEYAADSILSIIKDMAPEQHKTILFCKLFGTWTNCENIFFPIITEAGLCYTFNSLNMLETMVTNEYV